VDPAQPHARRVDRNGVPRGRGGPRELLSLSEERLGPLHIETQKLRNTLAQAERGLGESAGSEELLRDELELLRSRFGPDDVRLIEPLQTLATLVHTRGATEESLALFEEALRLCTRLPT
jgi:hypothetical protein